MTAIRTHKDSSLVSRTSSTLVALAIVNIALIPLLMGCDGSDAATDKATIGKATTVKTTNAADILRAATALDRPQPVYLPGGHTIDPNAVEGNVTTHEHD